jgi:outer membrane protein
MKSVLSFAVALSFLAISSNGFANTEGFRVGYVDLQKALTTVEAGKNAKDRLETEVSKKRKEFEKEEASLKKEAESFEKKAAILNDKAKAQQQAELQKKFMDFQRKMAESQMELQKRERDLTKPIIDEIRAIVEAIGKAKKFNLVLEKNEGAVLYSEAGTDLTEEVISTFNKKKK